MRGLVWVNTKEKMGLHRSLAGVYFDIHMVRRLVCRRERGVLDEGCLAL